MTRGWGVGEPKYKQDYPLRTARKKSATKRTTTEHGADWNEEGDS